MICRTCHLDKPLDAFPIDRTMRIGHRNQCKPCHCIQVHEIYRRTHPEQIKPEISLTSKICTHCQQEKSFDAFYKDVSKKDGYTTICKVCRCEQVKQYRLEHPEDIRAAKLAWKKTPNGKAAEKRLYDKNHDAINAKKRVDYAENIDEERAKSRENYAKNPEIALKRIRDWAAANPEKEKARVARGGAARRMRRELVINDFTAEQWQAILILFKYACAYCGKSQETLGKPLEQDHVIPLSKGGPHTASNIVPACRTCNARKHNHLGPKPIPPSN